MNDKDARVLFQAAAALARSGNKELSLELLRFLTNPNVFPIISLLSFDPDALDNSCIDAAQASGLIPTGLSN